MLANKGEEEDATFREAALKKFEEYVTISLRLV